MKNNIEKGIIGAVFLTVGVLEVFAQARQIEKDVFQPNWESFEAKYQCPEWFKDAKFGIWAHWSAQCVPEQGDWYAREMYIQGSRQYEYHVKTYGHPSKFGFMEFDNMWKAEHWDPEKLMKLFKKAGAKYFVALANHHDNFDTYYSKYHVWNSVNIGPKKDIVGIWEKVARVNGLRFGVSIHSAHAWHWFQTAYGYDGEGPFTGVRYDAATLTKEDGKGKWWEGLDPQELYTGPNIKLPEGIKGMSAVKDWHDKNDRLWTEKPPLQNPVFTATWLLRCKDLVDSYHPDLLYFDDYGLPLGQVGLDMVAHYYNENRNWHNGKLEAVVTAKELQLAQRMGVVEDIEKGVSDSIQALPWQTCSCIGEWHYKRSLYENKSYKSVGQIIGSLIDIVSKNGNMLLSIPMRGDGTIDECEVEVLEGLSRWMAINGDAIFGTRPWKIYGEGPTKIQTGIFHKRTSSYFLPGDFRFTRKGKNLYAFIMAWPAGKTIIIHSLAKNSELMNNETITGVELLGCNEKIVWKQTNKGLCVSLPDKEPSEQVSTLEIECD